VRQLVYCLRFMGQAVPVAGVPGGLQTASVVEPAAGESAICTAEMTFTGETIFEQRGTIEFGSHGHRLHVETLVHGRVVPSADPSITQGAIALHVTGGDGQFAGASGVITSNLRISRHGEIVDHQLGVLVVK
jgi:hypothetical protein